MPKACHSPTTTFANHGRAFSASWAVYAAEPKLLRQRLAALFFVTVFVASTFIPAASVYAAHQPAAAVSAVNGHIKQPPADANKPMPTNFAGPLAGSKAASPMATGATPSSMLGRLTSSATGSDPLSASPKKPSITPHELTDKRYGYQH